MNELRRSFHSYQCWNDLPDDLKCQADFALAAIKKQWIQTIEQVPLSLQQDPKFRRKCIAWGFRQRYDLADEITTFCDADYHELSDEWKADIRVIVSAIVYHRTTIRDIPEPYRLNGWVLRTVIRSWPRVVRDLPDSIRDDIEFWLSQPKLTLSVVHTIFKTDAGALLRPDRSFWVRLLNLESLQKLRFDFMLLVERHAPREIQLDRELISAIVQKDVYASCPCRHFKADIWQNETFMRLVCETMEPGHLERIPHHLQRRHPHLIREIVMPRVLNSTLPPWRKERLGQVLAYEFWDDFHSIQTWFTHKGPFLVGVMPRRWNLELDQFLWIAEHCPGSVAKRCFSCAAKERMEDASFLRQAIKLNPFLYCFATQDLQDDVELRMMVCSRVGSYRELVDDCGMSAEHVKETRAHAQAKYAVYRSFETFLFCMSHKTAAGPVTLLNQGPTTAMVYKSSVAKYLGIPRGSELQMFRKCVNNLEKWEEYVSMNSSG